MKVLTTGEITQIVDRLLRRFTAGNNTEFHAATNESLQIFIGRRVYILSVAGDTEIRKLEDEQERFVAAIAIAGNIEVLARALQDREERRSQIRSELAPLDRAEELGSFNVRHIERELRARLADWRELLRRQAPIARQVVTQLLDGRIVCTPHRDERLYEFAGRVKFDQLLSGIVLTQGVVPVRGYHTLCNAIFPMKLAFEGLKIAV